MKSSLSFTHFYFYPRSPCGERPVMLCTLQAPLWISIHALLAESDDRDGKRALKRPKFLSTLSLRRATKRFWQKYYINKFLSTLSLRRATSKPRRLKSRRMVFLSTLSLRRATHGMMPNPAWIAFLSTLSLRRATAKVHKTVGHFCAYETNFMGIASSC